MKAMLVQVLGTILCGLALLSIVVALVFCCVWDRIRPRKKG